MVRQGSAEECWPWRTGKRATFWWRKDDGSRLSGLAPRVAYLLAHGEIPEAYVVLHSCDNPTCCNPSHLSVGTQRENLLDMVRKGRHPSQTSENYRRTRFPGKRASGDRNGAARLTNDEVAEIRRMRSEGFKLREIAQKFKATPQYIWAIVHYKTRANG